MPALGELFPAYAKPWREAPAHCADAGPGWRKSARATRNRARRTHLDCARLRKLSPARAGNALRAFLAANGLLAPDSAMLREMLRQFQSSRATPGSACPHDGAVLRRYRDAVFVVACTATKPRAPISAGRASAPMCAGEGGGVFRPRSRRASAPCNSRVPRSASGDAPVREIATRLQRGRGAA